MESYKVKLKGVWGRYWEVYGAKMSHDVGIGCLSQADKYIDIRTAQNDGTLIEIFGENLATLPTNMQSVYTALLAHKKKINHKLNKEQDDQEKKQKHKNKQKKSKHMLSPMDMLR